MIRFLNQGVCPNCAADIRSALKVLDAASCTNLFQSLSEAAATWVARLEVQLVEDRETVHRIARGEIVEPERLAQLHKNLVIVGELFKARAELMSAFTGLVVSNQEEETGDPMRDADSLVETTTIASQGARTLKRSLTLQEDIAAATTAISHAYQESRLSEGPFGGAMDGMIVVQVGGRRSGSMGDIMDDLFGASNGSHKKSATKASKRRRRSVMGTRSTVGSTT